MVRKLKQCCPAFAARDGVISLRDSWIMDASQFYLDRKLYCPRLAPSSVSSLLLRYGIEARSTDRRLGSTVELNDAAISPSRRSADGLTVSASN